MLTTPKQKITRRSFTMFLLHTTIYQANFKRNFNRKFCLFHFTFVNCLMNENFFRLKIFDFDFESITSDKKRGFFKTINKIKKRNL